MYSSVPPPTGFSPGLDSIKIPLILDRVSDNNNEIYCVTEMK